MLLEDKTGDITLKVNGTILNNLLKTVMQKKDIIDLVF